MSQNIQDAFSQRLEEARREAQAEAIPMVFEGFPCRVRVLPRIFFIHSGRMPEHLTRKIINTLDRTGDAQAAEPSAAEIIEGENFVRAAVCAVLVEPPVVASGSPPEGGYLYADLAESAPKFVQAVYLWIMRDCPRPEDAAVKGGEVLTVADLEKFPHGKRRGQRARPRRQGKRSKSAAVRTDAAD